MKLSIIIPVYNVRDYLEMCVCSVISQRQYSYEVILVDDGSTDGSGELADYYASRFNGIVRVFHKANGGLMSAWTLGVRESKGDYIGFVDSDDSICKDMFDKMLRIAIETNADIVMCDSKDSISGATIKSSSIHAGLYDSNDMDYLKSSFFSYPGNCGVSNARWNKLYKRHIIIDNMKYTSNLSRTFEDRYIVPAAVMSAKSFYYLDEPLYVYTKNRAGSNSKKYKKDLIDDVISMYDIQKQVLVDKNLFTLCGRYWEKMFLDCIRIYVGRNLLKVPGFLKRYDSAKALFSCAYFDNRMEEYGRLLNGKMGIVIRLSYSFRSPWLLALLSYLA